MQLARGCRARRLWARAEPSWIPLGEFATDAASPCTYTTTLDLAAVFDESVTAPLVEAYRTPASVTDLAGSMIDDADEPAAAEVAVSAAGARAAAAEHAGPAAGPAVGAEADAGGRSARGAHGDEAEVTVDPPVRATLHLFIEVNGPEGLLRRRPQSIDIVTPAPLDYPHDVTTGYVALGRFTRTTLGGFNTVEVAQANRILPYITKGGNVVLEFNRLPRRRLKSKVTSVRVRHGRLEIKGHVRSSGVPLTAFDIELIGRVNDLRLLTVTTLTADTQFALEHYGKHKYFFSASIALSDLARRSDDPGLEDVFDVWASVDSPNYETGRHRLGPVPYLKRKLANEGSAVAGPLGIYCAPYFTFKSHRVAVRIERFHSDVLKRMLQATRPGTARRHSDNVSPVWLLGEMPGKAQDNGLELFTYIQDHHPEIDAYYVIDRDSPDLANLEDRPNVLMFRSFDHLRVTLGADRIIGTHHPDYLYPSRSKRFARHVHAVKVFQQHGIIGLRRIANLYGTQSADFETDAFIVSSQREKSTILTHFGYRQENVHVTGLARHDRLRNEAAQRVTTGDIAVIPTWREWLQNADIFEHSQYLERWQELCCDPRLHSAAAAMGGTVKFYIHPNMRQYRNHFDSTGVEVVDPGEMKMQDLLVDAAILITDYTSAALDFSLLHKPVVYYQFDRKRFFKEPPYLSLEDDLPGPLFKEAGAVLDYVEDRVRDGARMQPEYAQRADLFSDNRDAGARERIFAVAAAATHRPHPLVPEEFLRAAANVASRRKGYMTTVKRAYRLARRLPLRDDLVVFEAGVGRQMNDSPMAVYRELLRRGDQRTKVWVHNKRITPDDRNTIIVRRRSIEFFWYLARAKYWVNDQNFPFYIDRLGKGKYLQTWHGTPLKRMFNDLDEFVGRDSGYHSRVSTAIAQWTDVTSPSRYATEKFASAFDHRATVHEVGLPRNDSLVDAESDNRRDAVRSSLGIAPGVETYLYAPTFRDDQAMGSNKFGFTAPFALSDIVDSLPDSCVLLVRFHVVVKNRPRIPAEYRDRIIDVSTYGELNDLFLASDALITDYSSIFFDYSILRKPMIFFAYDLEDYRDNLRGFYLDYEQTVPGPIVQDVSDIGAAVAPAKSYADSSAMDEFIARFAPHEDGHAARRIADEFFE